MALAAVRPDTTSQTRRSSPVNFDFSTLIFMIFAVMALQPLLMGRWFALRRAQAIRAVEAHPAKVTVYVPVYAMSGGTLIALAADEIVMGEFSVLGPIDPQILGFPAASIVHARDAKPAEHVFDLTFVLADVGEKALAQVKHGAVELLTPRISQSDAEHLAEQLAGGRWTHDYALTAKEATALGLPINVGMPRIVLDLMKLYPQPVQTSSVEYLPIDIPRKAAP
jgi:ClpP class serine protease